MLAPAMPPLPGPVNGLVIADAAGETVVPLRLPVVLVGRSTHCDLVVDRRDLRPLHALLAPTLDGIHLRALHVDGVCVNGEPTTLATLHDGDTLDLGGIRATVRWATPADAVAPVEPLRLQAAAVIAQGLRLLDREAELLERADALSQQETQLATHLEAERQQLLDLQAQIAEARAALRRKRHTLADQADDHARALAAARDHEAAAHADRQRAKKLLQRLRSRYGKHVEAIEAEAAAREREFQAAQAAFVAEQAKAARTHDRWRAERDHAATERAAVERDRTALAAERAAHAATVAAYEGRERERVAAADRLRARVAADERELAELETRIAHRREQLPAPPPATAPTWLATQPAGDGALVEHREQLAAVAGDLADQRLLLVEQTERFVRQQAAWEATRDRELAAIEQLARRLTKQEQAVAAREAAAATLDGDREQLAADREQWERQQRADDARLADRQGRIDADDARLADRVRELHTLYAMWGRRRHTEVERLRVERDRTRDAYGQWQGLRETWLRERGRLLDAQEALAADRLAVEQAKADYPTAADDPAAARKRLERHRKQWAKHLTAARTDLDRLAATLAEESAALGIDQRDADHDRVHLAARDADLADLRADSERRLLQQAHDIAFWQGEARRLEQRLHDVEHEQAGDVVPLRATLQLRVA